MAAPAGQKYCTSCGQLILVNAEICPKCGVRQPLIARSGGKEKLAAALLAILLGGIGIHKFYLGQTGMGIVYLLFCWTGIPLLIGIVEGIILLSMSDEAFHAKYG